MSLPTPNGKPLRTELTPSSPSTQKYVYILMHAYIARIIDRGSREMNLQRWVWLEITVRNARSTNQTDRYYVPEDVIRFIPKYKAQLDEKLASIKGDNQPVIRDETVRDPEVVARAVRFLTSGYLYPLDTSAGDIKDTLDDLVKLYNFSTSLSIKRLEVGILDHIKNFETLTLAIFLVFARGYYTAHGVEAQDTSLGHLIKQKLAEFLPRMVDLKTVDEIKREGGILGQQLIEVLLDERAAIKAREPNAKETAVKIEIDSD